MSNQKGGAGAPIDQGTGTPGATAKDSAAAGRSTETTIVQRVLGRSALALESTITRLRRLQTHAEPRPGATRSADPTVSQQDRRPQPSPAPHAPAAASRPGAAGTRAPGGAPVRPGTAGSHVPGPAPPRAAPPTPTRSTPQGGPTRAPTAAKPGSPDSSKIAHDSRGNAIWIRAVSAGVQALESTSRLLKRLEAPELSIEDKPSAGLELEERDPGGGYDPYNQRKPPPGKR